jgi:hypothetical protein
MRRQNQMESDLRTAAHIISPSGCSQWKALIATRAAIRSIALVTGISNSFLQ